MRYCIKGGQILNPAGSYSGLGDLLIEDGKILDLGPNLPSENAQEIKAGGQLVLPGLIDLHAHLREPGREDKETIASGSRAALKGGFTAIACMANTNPVADQPAIISYIRQQGQKASGAKVYPVGAITKGLKGKELAEMGQMVEMGAVAFSDDGQTLLNPAVLRAAFHYAKLFAVPLLLHQECPELAGDGVMHEGYWSTVLGLPGIPALAEEVVIARDLLIAKETGGRIHCCHVSTKGAVELIRAAKQQGVLVTAEATPHHFTLTDEALSDYNTFKKVSPPLRGAADREAVRQGLADGTLDAIATDHAPHTMEEKHREFALAPNGIIGFETALSLAWSELVLPNLISPERMVELLAINPAQILQKSGGVLQPGVPADVVLFDPEREWIVKEEELESKSKNTPFLGQKLQGQVTNVWVDGLLKLAAGKIL